VLNFPITAPLKHHYRKKRGGPAREGGGFWPCGEEFSAGLIFLCFVSFHLRKRNEEAKKPLPGKIKIFIFLLISLIPSTSLIL
jgi:hypothetical protein